MIKIGDKYGAIYDKIINHPKYWKFVIETGIKFSNRLPMETINNRMYEQYKFFIPKKYEVVLDIGAYIGDYALIWEKLYGAKVYAFEGNYFNSIELIANKKINKADFTIFRAYIGDGTRTDINEDEDMSNTFSNSTKSLPTIKIDELDFNVYPTIVKIDIEGSEYLALQGMVKLLEENNIKLIIETHTSELYDLCYEFLDLLNYRLIASTYKGNHKILNEVKENYFYKGVI